MKPNPSVETRSRDLPTILFRMITTLALLSGLLLSPTLRLSGMTPAKKLQLKSGDTFHYKMEQIIIKNEKDTAQATTWITLNVIDKKDSIYTVVANTTRQIAADKKGHYTDTRDGGYTEFVTPTINQPIPFQLTEYGKVLPVVIPDTTINRYIDEKYKTDIFKASLFIKNFKNTENPLTDLFQRFFVDWENVKQASAEKPYLNGYLKTSSTFEKSGDSQQITVKANYVRNDSTSLKTPNTPEIIKFRRTGIYLKDQQSGALLTYSGTEQTTYHFKEELIPITVRSEIFSDSPENSNTIVLAGRIESGSPAQTMTFSIPETFVEQNDFNYSPTFQAGKSFHSRIPLKKSVAVCMNPCFYPCPETTANLLLEPGDSIYFSIGKNNTVISGKGSLKNRIYQTIMHQLPWADYTVPENDAQQMVNDWIKKRFQILEHYKDSISHWAYNLIRSDIYYAGQRRLYSYYASVTGQSPDKGLFERLFGNMDWQHYQSTSSLEMKLFQYHFLRQKLLTTRNETVSRAIPDTELYYFTKILFNGQMAYVALSQIVYDALRRADTSEGKAIFLDYEKKYAETDYYKSLKKQFIERINLGKGSEIPNFEASDINGKAISLSKLKGKYVQLLFIDLGLEHQANCIAQYQKMKEELPDDKFELVTVFVNKDKALTKTYLKEHKLKGIIIQNPGWELGELKKFRVQFSDPFFLSNPEGIIVFTGAGSPNREFVQMFIDMIKRATIQKAEASFSAKTLYGVLVASGILLLLAFSLLVIIPRRIRKREAARREQLDLKLKAVRTQLNPHFLFNCMNSIQYLVNHNETEKANLFLSKFGQLMRKVLNQSEVELIPLKDELETIETYLGLEALRHHFKFAIRVDAGVDLFNIEIPVMLLQPFVENAVIHGISEKGKDGLIEIEVEKINESRIMIIIADNGKGIQQQADSPKNSNGKGIQITQQRINLMMANYGQHIDFKIQDRKQKGTNGTKVTITFSTEE